jgi:NitT/TauT family transport system substrate-binding protein
VPRLVLLVVAGAVAAAGLAACGGDDDDGGGGPASLVVQDTAGVPSAFLSYGVEQGFFSDQDLEVEVQPSQGGATVVPAVTSGSAQIGGSNLVSILLAKDEGLPLKVVAPGTFVQDDPEQDFSAILVAGDSDIRSPQDLEGATLAVNTLKNVAEVTAKESLSKKGVDISQVKLTEVDFPDMVAALDSGRVDAAFAIEPFVTQGINAGQRVIDRPYVGTKPGLQIGCYFTSEEYLSENRDVVERFHEGIAATAESISEDPDSFRAFLPEASEIPPPAAEAAILPLWQADSDEDSLELLAELMERYGVTEGRPDTSEVIEE